MKLLYPIKRGILTGLAVAVVISMSSVSTLLGADPEVDLSKLPPAAKKEDVSFEKDIKPIIDKSCLKCHSGDRPKARYLMTSKQAFIKGGESEAAAIVPKNVKKSLALIYAADLVEEMEMPPVGKRKDFPQLTKEQLALLRAWIEQGAK
jgi:uncharacterized membrane protein